MSLTSKLLPAAGLEGVEHHPLCSIVENRIGYASTASGWYRRKKRLKQYGAKGMRFIAFLCAVLGSSYPLYRDLIGLSDPNLGYLVIAAGGSVLLLDRLFGVSSGWSRFIRAATEIESETEAFRMHALKLMHTFPDDKIGLLELCQSFTEKVSRIVRLETEAWAEEFAEVGSHIVDLTSQRKQSNQEGSPSNSSARPVHVAPPV